MVEHRCQVALGKAVICLNDLTIFDVTDVSCPVCAATIGIGSVRVGGKADSSPSLEPDEKGAKEDRA